MSKGTAWERELKNGLESLGYSVIRGAGSKGTFLGEKVDLVVSKRTKQNLKIAFIFGVQCKVKGA